MTANDTNEAVTRAVQSGLALCTKIRETPPAWRSEDASYRHLRILQDLQRNFIPLASGFTATVLQGAINGEREAFN